ncbi:MAG: hypothetical protein LJE68_03735 [Rhodobacter sp.]|nr:hypothetical protein [Rhodobacter sp.]
MTNTANEPSQWRTLTALEEPTGYTVIEADARFIRERLAENTLRLVGAFMILAGYVQWFLPGLLVGGGPVHIRIGLTVVFMGVGLAVYLLASRGFRRVLQMDLAARRVAVARVNSKNRSMFRLEFSMDEIESAFVKRSKTAPSQAALNIRVRNSGRCLDVLFGDPRELDALHKLLCQNVRMAMECAPRRVRNLRSATGVVTPRPNRRVRKLRPVMAAAIAAE